MIGTREVPNSRNLPVLLELRIRGGFDPHTEGRDVEGYAYLAPEFKAHLALCEKCSLFFVGQIAALAKHVAEIGVGGIKL